LALRRQINKQKVCEHN